MVAEYFNNNNDSEPTQDTTDEPMVGGDIRDMGGDIESGVNQLGNLLKGGKKRRSNKNRSNRRRTNKRRSNKQKKRQNKTRRNKKQNKRKNSNRR